MSDSVAAQLLGSQVQTPRGHACLSVSGECCILPGTAACDHLILRPEESHRVCCVLSVIRYNINPVQCRFYIEVAENRPKIPKLNWTE